MVVIGPDNSSGWTPIDSGASSPQRSNDSLETMAGQAHLEPAASYSSSSSLTTTTEGKAEGQGHSSATESSSSVSSNGEILPPPGALAPASSLASILSSVEGNLDFNLPSPGASPSASAYQSIGEEFDAITMQKAHREERVSGGLGVGSVGLFGGLASCSGMGS